MRAARNQNPYSGKDCPQACWSQQISISLFHTRLQVWFIVLQDELCPQVAESESDKCTKHKTAYLSMIHTVPDHGQAKHETEPVKTPL